VNIRREPGRRGYKGHKMTKMALISSRGKSKEILIGRTLLKLESSPFSLSITIVSKSYDMYKINLTH
jgi:hypothetical protein